MKYYTFFDFTHPKFFGCNHNIKELTQKYNNNFYVVYNTTEKIIFLSIKCNEMSPKPIKLNYTDGFTHESTEVELEDFEPNIIGQIENSIYYEAYERDVNVFSEKFSIAGTFEFRKLDDDKPPEQIDSSFSMADTRPFSPITDEDRKRLETFIETHRLDKTDDGVI